MAGLERILALLAAPNAKSVGGHKTKAIAAIELLAYGDDTRLLGVQKAAARNGLIFVR